MNFISRILAPIFAVACIFTIVPAVFGQMDQGVITGTVQDVSGALIPNAQITLTNTDMGLASKTASNASGVYVFPPAKVGNYTVNAAAAGFETTVQENIHLDVQDRLNIVLTLRPGAISQTVTVSSAPPLLQSQQGSVGQLISARTIDHTPLNGRNWVYIAQMAAGVDPSNGARGVGEGDFNANGQRAEQNNFILDGVDNNTGAPDFLNGSSYVVQPPPDALSEFKLQTSDYSAEFGHSAGAVVNATIKSGTNAIHGDLWEYVRNNALDARDFDALTIPKYRENQFGATLGLPIIRNKLFFFGYTEANRIIFGETGSFSVPSSLMRQGNFSELLNPALTSSGTEVPLYQPGSAGTVPLECNGQANVICSSQIDSVAQTLLNLYPLPNTNNGKLYDNYISSSNAQENVFQWGGRLDWNIRSKDQAFVRFSYVNIPQYYPPPLGPIADGGTYGTDGNIKNRGENFAFSETHVFNGTLTNEFRVGYNYGNFLYLQSNYNTDIASSLGLGGIPTGPQLGGLPDMTLTGLSFLGTPGYFPNQKTPNDYQILDNIMKVIGNHSIRAGVDFQSHRVVVLVPPAARGDFTYSGYYTSIPGKANTGFGAADFLLNSMDSATLSNEERIHDSRWYRAAYIQDDWKVNPRLTLNLGLRYDFYQPTKEINGQQANFQPLLGTFAPGSGQGVLVYSKLYQNQFLAPAFLNYLTANNVSIQYSGNPAMANAQALNFAPRIGFAYGVDNTTVLRGGFGIFYGGLENIGAPGFLENYPYQFNSTFPQPSSCTPGACPTNGILLETGFQQSISEGLVNFVSEPTFSGIQPNIKTPYSEDYNLTAEKSLARNLVASIGYVGNVNRHLQITPNVNSPVALTDPRLNSNLVQPFPTLGSTGLNSFVGVATYNSLQTRVEKRYASGLNFLATYTWSHALDDALPPLGTNGISGYRGINLIGYLNDYHNSSWNVRNRVTFNGYYELPFGNGRHFLNRPGVINALAGGWSTDLQFSAQTGFPFTVGTDLGSAGPNGGTAEAIQIRDPFAPGGSPDPSNPGVTCPQHTRNKVNWYNPCAFANPPLAFTNASVAGSPISTNRIVGLAALPYLGGRPANATGPGYERINISLFKDFSIFREQSIEFRADIFNVLNTPAYGAPSVTTNASTGGQITTAHVFQNFTPDARFFQISARYSF